MLKKALFIFLVFITLSNINITEAASGHLQIVAAPDIDVFLNTNFKGTTSKDYGGLVIKNLSTGTYNVRLVKKGFAPQIGSVTINSGKVAKFTAKAFTSTIESNQSGSNNSGRLVIGDLYIQSLPIKCKVSIPSINYSVNKNEDDLNISEIPIGTYQILFELESSQKLKTNASITSGKKLHLFADFTLGKVINITEKDKLEVIRKTFKQKWNRNEITEKFIPEMTSSTGNGPTEKQGGCRTFTTRLIDKEGKYHNFKFEYKTWHFGKRRKRTWFTSDEFKDDFPKGKHTRARYPELQGFWTEKYHFSFKIYLDKKLVYTTTQVTHYDCATAVKDYSTPKMYYYYDCTPKAYRIKHPLPKNLKIGIWTVSMEDLFINKDTYRYVTTSDSAHISFTERNYMRPLQLMLAITNPEL